MRIVRTSTPQETRLCGRHLAEQLLSTRNKKRREASVFALVGNLGSGKTTFVQGFAEGLKISRRLTSPSFVLFRRYRVRTKSAPFLWLYHIDGYRLRSRKDFDAIDLAASFRNPHNCLLIEWPRLIRLLLPASTRWISFLHRGGTKRDIRL